MKRARASKVRLSADPATVLGIPSGTFSHLAGARRITETRSRPPDVAVIQCDLACSPRHPVCHALRVREPIDERWSSGTAVLVRGHRWTVVGETRFGDCVALTLTGSGVLPAVVRTLLLPFDRPHRIEPPSVVVVRPRQWLRRVQRAAADTRPFGGLFPGAAGAIELHSYQLEPAIAMLRESATRVLIADAVGLGKTIQAGFILRQLATERHPFRALVVVPAALRDQWGDELRTRFDLQPNIVVAPWLARAARELPHDVSPWALPGIYICSFEFIRRPEVLRPLEDTGWDLLVVDEAHAARAGTARRAAVHAVALRSRRVLLLTATPHAGEDDDFRALCAIGTSELRPDPIVLFQRSRADIGISAERRTTFVAVTLSDAERDVHRLLERYTSHLCAASRLSGDRHTRLLAIVLRKRALSCLSVLVRSCRRRLALLETERQGDIGEQLSLPLDDDETLREDADCEAVLAAPGLADVARERHWLEAIVAMGDRVVDGESKIARLKKLLRRIKEPAIVFTEYRDTLISLAEVLRSFHPDLSVLHGGMAADERLLAQRHFNEKGTLLLATDAASEGLNLQYRCRTVIHFELPWSPARLEQRAGRVDRIGQRRVVHEMMLVASDTAERLVLAPLARRALRVQAVAPAGTGLAARLSESRVAAAIMDGIPLESTQHAVEAETCRPAADLRTAADLETKRISELRKWGQNALPRSFSEGIPAVVMDGKHLAISPGVVRLCVLALTAEDGAILHTEIVALHENLDVGRPKTPQDVRATIASLNLDGSDRLAECVALFEERTGEVRASCARVASALIGREMVVSRPASSSAQQLLQRGLFDRRLETGSEDRARTNRAILEEAADRMASLKSCFSVTPCLKLHAILLVTDPERA